MHPERATLVRFAAFCGLLAALLCAPVRAEPPHRPVLVVHSYSQDFPWTRRVMEGMLDALRREGPQAHVHVEYLDAKLVPPERIVPPFEEFLIRKYADHRPEVILVSDDAAFGIMLDLRDRIFPGVPLVFCGVNDFREERIAGRAAVTGVVEDFDLAGTVEAALRLQPGVRQMAVVSDATETGRLNMERFRRIKDRFRDRLEFLEFPDSPAGELLPALKALPRGTPLLHLSYYRDRAGRTFTIEEMMDFQAEAGLPIYVAWDFLMGHGAVGGRVVSGRQQGEAAGAMAARILRGEPAEGIAVLRESPNLFMFDHEAMTRFGLPESALPPDSLIINRPSSFYEVNKALLWTGGAAMALMAAVIAVLARNILARREAMRRLRESEEQYRTLFENGHAAMLLVGPDTGRIEDANPAAAAFYGWSREAMRTMTVFEINTAAQVGTHLKEALRLQRNRFLFQHRLADGSLRDVEVYSAPMAVKGRTLLFSIIHDVTAAREAARDLAARTSEVETFFAVAPSLLLIADAQSRLLRLNQAWESALGYAPDELLGRHFLDSVHPDDAAATLEAMRELGSGQLVSAFVNRYRHKNGSWRSLEWNAVGRDGMIYAAAADVTERRALEDFQLFLLEMGWSRSGAGFFGELAQSLSERLGMEYVRIDRLEQDGLAARTMACSLDGRLLENFSHGLANSPCGDLVGRKVCCVSDGLTEMYPQNKALADLQARCYAGVTLWGGDGRPLGLLVAMGRRPLTDRRLTESMLLLAAPRAAGELERTLAGEELARQKNMLNSLVEGTSDAVFIKDMQGRYLMANSAVARVVGRPVEDIVGRDDAHLFPPDQAAAIRENDLRVMAEGEIRTYEEHLTTTDGPRIYLATKGPLRDGQGGVAGMFGISRDISDRFRMEEELRGAKEAAETASRAKTEFLANMSHELRTPMNGVLGMLQLLNMTALDQEQRELVDVARQSGLSLVRLLSDILDLSRIEAGKMDLSIEEFSPAKLVDEVIMALRVQASAKGVELRATRAGEIPDQVLGDPMRIRQALFNLAGNAVKFTQEGGVTVSLACPADNGNLRLVLIVADTGIGIPEDKLETIFEPFTQAEGAFTRRYGGAGLGLSIVRRITTLMGGEITVTSRVGQGATFRLEVPVRRVEPAAATAQAPAVPRGPSARARVLVVEDEAVNQLATLRLLEKMGCQARGVEDGRQALAALAAEPFDLVLMDIRMPDLDGVEATRIIRNDPAYASVSGIPIIAVTAYAMKGDKETFLAAGMDGYVAKPITVEGLQAALDKALRKAGA